MRPIAARRLVSAEKRQRSHRAPLISTNASVEAEIFNVDWLTASLIALGILALVVVGFFAVFRGKGKFRLQSPFGSASAEGENSEVVAPGIKIGKVDAGKKVRIKSTSHGGVDVGGIKAEGGVQVSHTPAPPNEAPRK